MVGRVDVVSEEKKLDSKRTSVLLCLICFILIRQLGTLRIVRRLRHSLDSVDSTRLGQLPGMAETAINRDTGRYKKMLINGLSVG